MKYISEMKPVVQTSFEIGVCEPEDIIISAEDTRLGTLYFSSNMPSFRQTAKVYDLMSKNISKPISEIMASPTLTFGM